MNFQRSSRPQTVLITNIIVLGVFGLFLIAKFIQAFEKVFAQGLALWTYTDWPMIIHTGLSDAAYQAN